MLLWAFRFTRSIKDCSNDSKVMISGGFSDNSSQPIKLIVWGITLPNVSCSTLSDSGDVGREPSVSKCWDFSDRSGLLLLNASNWEIRAGLKLGLEPSLLEGELWEAWCFRACSENQLSCLCFNQLEIDTLLFNLPFFSPYSLSPQVSPAVDFPNGLFCCLPTASVFSLFALCSLVKRCWFLL